MKINELFLFNLAQSKNPTFLGPTNFFFSVERINVIFCDLKDNHFEDFKQR